MLKRDELKNIELNQKKIEIYKGLNKLSISNLYKKYES